MSLRSPSSGTLAKPATCMQVNIGTPHALFSSAVDAMLLALGTSSPFPSRPLCTATLERGAEAKPCFHGAIDWGSRNGGAAALLRVWGATNVAMADAAIQVRRCACHHNAVLTRCHTERAPELEVDVLRQVAGPLARHRHALLALMQIFASCSPRHLAVYHGAAANDAWQRRPAGVVREVQVEHVAPRGGHPGGQPGHPCQQDLGAVRQPHKQQ